MVKPLHILAGVVLLILSFGLSAQSNTTGFIFGRIITDDGESARNALITISNLQSGTQRALPAREDGSFRFTALPIGRYSILIEADGYSEVEEELTVNVGSGTLADVSLVSQQDVKDLGVLEVRGGRFSTVDVSSTESTSIFSDESITRLPVERNM
jgi:hypothetical protein